MNRMLKIGVNEILCDPAKASETVNSACSHARHMRLTGCCDIGGVVMLVFEECAKQCPVRHVFAQFPDSSEDGVAAEINTRYLAGMSTVGSFRAGDALWGLFSYDPDAPAVHREG